jgi:hypothetical protein
MSNQWETARLALEKGAQVNVKESVLGKTALASATEGNHAAGADLSRRPARENRDRLTLRASRRLRQARQRLDCVRFSAAFPTLHQAISPLPSHHHASAESGAEAGYFIALVAADVRMRRQRTFRVVRLLTSAATA